MSKWISVNDRLPEESGRYLVFFDHKYKNGREISLCDYFNAADIWTDLYGRETSDLVTHWMPLPEPPEREV